MTLPASDTFSGSVGSALSASWTTETNGGTGSNILLLDGAGNATCSASSTDDCRSYWNADTFANDQYTEIVTGFTGPGDGTAAIEIMVRASGNFTGLNDTRYVLSSDGGSSTNIAVKNNNVQGGTVWTDNTFTFVSGDTIRFAIAGSTNPTLSVYKNGTLFASTTDTSAHQITSGGSPGIGGYDGGIGVVKIASWTGGNLSTSGTIASNLTPLTIAATGGASFGTAAANLTPLTVAASGTVGSGATTGTVAANLTPLTAASTGNVSFSSTLNATLPGLTVALLGGDPPLRNVTPAGFVVGYALANGFSSLTDAYVYEGVAGREFNAASPENGFKMGEGVHPTQSTYDFTETDAEVAFMQSKSQAITACGPLIWGNNLPSWLSGGSWTSGTLTTVMYDWIDTMVGRYAGQIATWEVVNEPINTSSIWNTTIGSTYIDLAFRRAHAADPAAILIINEYNVEEGNATSDSYYTMVSGLVSGGTPIHGVGFQFHATESGYNWASVATNLARFAALGLKLYITELDVRIPDPPSGTDLTNQASVYSSMFTTALAQPAVKGVTMWGFTDNYSWIPSSFSGNGQALLFDTNYNAKPAYASVHNALVQSISGTIAATLPSFTVASAGTEQFIGLLPYTLPRLSVNASGVTSSTVGSIAFNLAGLTVASSGTEQFIGTITPNLTALTIAATATTSGGTGTIAANLPALTIAANGLLLQPISGTVALTLSNIRIVGVGTGAPVVHLGQFLPQLSTKSPTGLPQFGITTDHTPPNFTT